MTFVNEHHDARAEHNGFEHVGILLTHMRMEWLLQHFPPRLVWAVYVCVNSFITINQVKLVVVLTGCAFVCKSMRPNAYLFCFAPKAEVSSPRNTILAHAIVLIYDYAAFALTVFCSPPFAI